MQNRPGMGGAPPPQRYVSYIESRDYLGGGYLDARGNPRPELITAEAEKVKDELVGGRPPLTYGQLRRFFAKVRFIELRLNADHDAEHRFEAVRWRIASLSRDAEDAVKRGVAPPEFRRFIDKNVQLGMKDENHFRKGLVEHFQSVVCYFPRGSSR